MEKYISELEKNVKVDSVTFQLNPSLNDQLDYKRIDIIIKTKRNLFNWAKSIYITPIENKFEIEMTCCDDPSKSILKDLYEKYRIKAWTGKCKTQSTNPVINLKGDEQLVNSLINYMFSKIN